MHTLATSSRFVDLAADRCVDMRGIKGEMERRERERGRERVRRNEDERGRANSVDESAGSLEVARKDCRREKRAGSRPGARAFIAYGSAKHLWNNGGRPKYIAGEEKRKYLARESRKMGFYCAPLAHTTSETLAWKIIHRSRAFTCPFFFPFVIPVS